MSELYLRSITCKALGDNIGKQLYELEKAALKQMNSLSDTFEKQGVPLDNMEAELKSYINAAYKMAKLKDVRDENNQ